MLSGSECFHEWIKETIEIWLIYQNHHQQQQQNKRFLNCNY